MTSVSRRRARDRPEEQGARLGRGRRRAPSERRGRAGESPDRRVIFAEQAAAAQVAREATERVPVVFSAVGDPVAAGLVKTIAHPETNVTGVSGLTTELVPKRLEFLKAAVPAVHHVWAVYDAADSTSRIAAQTPGLWVSNSSIGRYDHHARR